MTAGEPRIESGATDALDALARIASEAGARALTEEARSLGERIAAGRFYLACVGQFKRGKSTLINALVGRSVLPTGVVPVTAIPTVIREGDDGARVWLQDAEWHRIGLGELAQYVTEELNPGNAKGVVVAEVTLRSPLLRAGCCLVDTPGLGSVFEATSAAARGFVPQIDAAIVVVGADPPISGEELTLVREVGESVDDLIFVLNKMDRIPEPERREALVFTERVVRDRLGRPPGHVFEVSALRALRGEGHAGEWPAFAAAVERLPAQRGRLVRGAASRGITRLGLRLERVLQQQRTALLLPLEESERQVRELRDIAAGTNRALAELGPVLGGEQQRLRRRFEERREAFLKRIGEEAQAELRRRLDQLSFGGRIDRALALETASALARECITPWLAESERDAEDAYREATRRFAEYGSHSLARVATVMGLDSSALRLEADSSDGFRTRRGFYWHDLLYRHDPPHPWRHWADRILPVTASRRRVIEAAGTYLADLLFVNASRVEGDLNDRVQESRRQLEVEVAALLREVIESAEEALERARRVRSSGVEFERAALATVEQRLRAVELIMAERGRAA
jgi:GTP-binding protein EngB required for normal cell division